MIENPTPEFVDQVELQRRAAMAQGGTQGAPASIFGAGLPSVLPKMQGGQGTPTGGVPSVLPASSGQSQAPTVLPAEVTSLPTKTVSVLPGGGTPVAATQVSPMAPRLPMASGIRSIQSVTQQPSVVPSAQRSVMQQIAGVGGLKGVSTMPPALRGPSLSARPDVQNFARPRRKQGPGIRLTGMKLY